MSVFLRCPCVGGRGTFRPKGCPDTHTWQYKFKEAFGGPLMAKYGERYATFRKVQQGDTGHWNKSAAQTHEGNLRKDMRLVKSGEQPVGPLRIQASMGETVTKLATLLTAYLEWLPRNLAKSTVPSAAHACRTFVDFLGGDRFIQTIDPQDFENWKGHRQQQKTTQKHGTVKQSYINTQLLYIRGMFREAEVFYKGFTSPFTPVVIAGERRCPIGGFTIKKTPKRVPTPEEYAAMIARLPDPYDLIAQTQFETSARVGEVCALKKGDVGLYPDGEAGWFQRELKGGDTHRSDLSKELAIALLAKLKAQGPQAQFFFPHPATPFRHLVNSTVSARLRELFDAMGYGWMTSHRFRHLSIRSMLDRRVADVDIAKMTGWTSTKQIAEYAGDRTQATKAIGRENATAHQQMMAHAPAHAEKVTTYAGRKLARQTRKAKKGTVVLPFKKTGVA